MLNFFDLYDLHAIFVNIRNNALDSSNEKIITQILQVLKNRNENFEFNQIRNALKVLNLSNQKEYSFVFTNNVYPYVPYVIKEEKIYELFQVVCEELLGSVRQHRFSQVFDLADAVHNLPLVLAENKLHIPQSFWKNEINYYRKNWDRSFLKKFERNF